MGDFPLTITSIMRHGTELFPGHEVVTYTGDGFTRQPYGELALDAARLANALRGLGVTGDQRVATFMWNNAAHLAAYLAVPSMGAVLHTLNIRLYPEQLTYIANHAEDDVLLVDATLIPLLAPILPQLKTVRHVIVVGEGSIRRAAGPRLPDAPRRLSVLLRLAGAGRELGRGDVLHQRHHRQPQGRRLQPPFGLPALDVGLYGATPWVCPPMTGSCRSCRCSTPTPGACRTPP